MLAVRDLHVALAGEAGWQRAIDGLDLAIARGETYALVGESGCGKSLTALALLRLLPEAARITAGQVWLAPAAAGGPDVGQDLLALPEAAMRRQRGRRVAMVFQEPGTSLNPVLTIGRQVQEVVEAHTPLRGVQARAKALHWLREVGLPEPERRFDDHPFRLSGGQKQRVVIAIALAGEPDLLLADEPTTALDVTVQAQVLALLQDLQRRHRMALLLITHDLAVVAGLAQTVALMYAGQIVEVAPAARFFSQPRHPYARALLRALPDGRAAVGPRALRPPLQAIPGGVPALGQWPAGCRFAPRCAWASEACRQQVPALQALPADLALAPGTSPAAARAAAAAGAAEGAAEGAEAPAPVAGAVAGGGGPHPSSRPTSPTLPGAAPAPHLLRCLLAGAVPPEPAPMGAAAQAAGPAAEAVPRAPPAEVDPGPAADRAPVLRVHGLHVTFQGRRRWWAAPAPGHAAVQGLDLVVPAGGTLALVGASGCGKTTTGRAIVQLLRGQAQVQGQALLADGQDLFALQGAALRAARRQVQIIFQDPYASLNPRLRVAEILDEGLRALRPELGAAQRRARVQQVAEQVGLASAALQRWPHEFSGGQRQRIAIARALVVEPALIVCDEPTSALDVSVQAQILNLLRALQADTGVGYLFISHNLAVVGWLADRIAVMDAGRIVEQGDAAALLARPQHAATQALLAAMPPRPA